MKLAYAVLVLFIASLMLVPLSSAAYQVQNLNVSVHLNPNTSAQVTESLKIVITNSSIQQYSTNRLALNLTLSGWQTLIGPMLVQHIINPTSGLYNFKFLPGPVVTVAGQSTAFIILTYNVSNVTTVNETAPRIFLYKFKANVLNFAHGESGEVLSPNTTLTVSVPPNSTIESVYPSPDEPPYAFTNSYKNVTSVSWKYGEPLSKFAFTFIVHQSIEAEVEGFFTQAYDLFGIWTYVIIIVIIIAFVAITYFRASR